MKIKAIFFDFDGVLIDSMPAHETAWQKILAEIGINVDKLYFRIHEGEKAELTINNLLAEHGKTLPTEEQAMLIEKKRSLYKTIAPAGLIPEARKLIDAAIKLGVKCNIVTGSIRNNMNSVLVSDEFELFEHIITAEMYMNGKPFPDPYLMGLAKSGYSAENSIVLENAPMGIKSAKAAGLKTVAITSTLPPEYLKEADEIIKEYQELLKFL